jgi:hypothetical protein
MYNSLSNVFEEALNDDKAAVLDGVGYDSRMLYGCKITRDNDTGEILIQNTAMGGDYYKDITYESEWEFVNKGWRHGVYSLCIKTYHEKLKRIEVRIKEEMNTKQNPKQIQHLKNHRERILKKYNTINNKLKSLNYE